VNPAIERLEPFIGDWSLPGGGRTLFEWGPARQFLVQRWHVPIAAVPDGIAIVAFDSEKDRYRQHYFDSRGVVRVYEMAFDGTVWKLWRSSPDFSPLEFHQRFEGGFSSDGNMISGRWESSPDGSRWKPDFELTYTTVE
jgi:hypothetical protein